MSLGLHHVAVGHIATSRLVTRSAIAACSQVSTRIKGATGSIAISRSSRVFAVRCSQRQRQISKVKRCRAVCLTAGRNVRRRPSQSSSSRFAPFSGCRVVSSRTVSVRIPMPCYKSIQAHQAPAQQSYAPGRCFGLPTPCRTQRRTELRRSQQQSRQRCTHLAAQQTDSLGSKAEVHELLFDAAQPATPSDTAGRSCH